MSFSLMQMQPLPTKADFLEQGVDATPCYIWIHMCYGPGRVITFPSIKQAYIYAEKFVYENEAKPLEAGRQTDPAWDNIWTAADGAKWIVPGMTWGSSLEKIYQDYILGCEPADQQWMTVSTGGCQMILGIGSDLPEHVVARMINPHGYTLMPWDHMPHMPLIKRLPTPKPEPAPEPASAPQRPTPLNLGPYEPRHIADLEPGERSPNLLAPTLAEMLQLMSAETTPYHIPFGTASSNVVSQPVASLQEQENEDDDKTPVLQPSAAPVDYEALD